MSLEPESHPEILEIGLPSGIQLQGDLWKPPLHSLHTARDGNKLAVCLHPWSWLGGSKEDPVLMTLLPSLLSQDYHVLCYNSRGVGKSTGWASFTGFSEAEDLKALIKWAMETISNVHSVVLVGYSHGSLIASLHPVLSSVKTSHILISYPLGPRTFLTLFHSSTYINALKDLDQHPDSKVLIIYGDSDEFTSQSRYRSWASSFQDGNVDVVEVKSASHFWHGRRGRELAEIIKRWLP